MPKRKKKAHRPSAVTRHAVHRTQQDPLAGLATALVDDEPLSVLMHISLLLGAVDPRSDDPFVPREPDAPTQDDLIGICFDVERYETSVMLVVLAALLDDDLLRRRAHVEVTRRGHALPPWLAGLASTSVPEVITVEHVLGDGDNLVLGLRLTDGREFALVAYIDHNMGTVLKDAFPLELGPGDSVRMMLTHGDEDTAASPLDPADARTRITDAIERSSRIYPRIETETWPGSRALLEWVVRLLPEGGSGYQRPEWDDDARAALVHDVISSTTGLGDDDARSLLGDLVWFGADYGPGDPLRWSPVAVEILMADWFPRKIVADVSYLARLPEVLRIFIRYCHTVRGIRPALTEETVAAVDEYEPEYQRVIRTVRPQGAEALAAALAGAWSPPDDLGRAVGGPDALAGLAAVPLPDEAFAWDVVPTEVRNHVREVLALVDACCENFFDVEFRTACRRLLARVAEADPALVSGRAKAANTAAAVVWLVGKANDRFSLYGLTVKQVLAWFGPGTTTNRSSQLVRALGLGHQPPGEIILGSAELLTAATRAAIIAERDA